MNNQNSVFGGIIKRFVTLLLVLFILLPTFPAISVDVGAVEADVADTGASVGSGDGTWISGKLTYEWNAESSGTTGNSAAGSVSVSNNTLTVTATNSKKSSHTSGCDTVEDPPCSTTTTVTVTNASSYPLKFNTLTTSGSASVSGVSQGDTIASGGDFMITITAPAKDTATKVTGTVTVSVEEQTSVTITLKPSPYVGYTVNNKTVAQNGTEQPFTVDVGTSVPLPSISAPSGYKFAGWRIGSELKTGINSFKADAGYDVFPVIVTAGTDISTANFKVGSNTYTFWENAVTAAIGGGKMFVNLEEVNLPNNVLDNLLPASGGTYVKPVSGGGVEYILPAGVTMVVPKDTSTTVHTTTPEYKFEAHVNPTPFRTLTVPNGAKITVNGSVSVDSKVCAQGQNASSWNGTPSGPHGKIVMKTGSEMTFNSGANLYCYGYINGDGNVKVNSGATVYELFQFRDWRGGTATNGLKGNSERIFPMNQYYVQNVEAPMTLYKGATEKVCSCVNMNSGYYPTDQIEFIGSNGMFKLTGNDSDYITKRYHANVDRLEIAVHGNMTVNALNVKITGLPLIGTIDIKSADYVLPLNNMNIWIQSGTTSIASSQTYGVAFLPSSKLTVDQNAAFTVNAPTYFYDADDWGIYAADSAKLVPVGYSTANGTTAIRTEDNLKDAELDVNGTLTVSNKLYTTAHGANITSSEGTGQINFSAACATSTTTTYQYDQKNGKKDPITCNNAWLQNGDESYSKTIGTGTSTWKYDKPGEHWYRYLVDFKYNDTLIDRGYYCENNDTVTYDASWLTNLGATASNGTAAVDGTNVNVTGVTANSVVTLTGIPAEYIPTFVLSEEEYTKHYKLYNSGDLPTTTIGDETYYVVKQAESALAVGTTYVAPTDAEMGVSTANHNDFLWNLSGVSFTSGDPYRGIVPAGETAGGPVYIYGFYEGVIAHNSWNNQYYPTLIEAFEVLPQDVSATITLLADCGTFEEESGTVAYTAYTANNVTLDLNGHHAVGRIINNGTFTLELNGGSFDYETGATAAATDLKGMATIINSGTLTVQDTVGGGKITADAISNTSGADGSAVIRNNDGATLTVTGKDAEHLLPLEHKQNVNATNYGIYNLGTITALTNVDISTENSGTGGINLYNYNTGVVQNISGGHMFCNANCSIFNYGGTINTVDGLTIDGKNGIVNRNIVSGKIATGYTVADADKGIIDTITKCHVEVGQYAIHNHAVINTLSGSTFIAHPDSAQVDTRGNGDTASEGDVQCYTVFNNNDWWYNTNVWKRTDSSSGEYKRVDDYKEEEEYRPSIGTITDCEIYAENTSASASYGYALVNYGVINKIGGTANVKAYKHPDNAKISTSHYSLVNTGGGIIKSIEGTVNVSATAAYAVVNDAPFTTKIEYTYGNKVGGNITHQKNTYGKPATINSIACAGTWSVGSYYALLNNGYIQTINAPDLTLTGNYNVLYNSTGGSNSTYEITRKYTDPATASTEYERNTEYVKNLEKGSTIDTINDITITVKGKSAYQGLNNQGHIGTLSNVDVGFASGATNHKDKYPLVVNGDSRYKSYTETIRTNRTSETDPHLTVTAGVVTRYDRDYTYDTPTIDVIDNLTSTSIDLYSFRNAGHVGTLKNSTITGTQYALHNSASGPYTERQTLQYYSGTGIFTTTKYTSEYAKHYKRNPSTIDTIDNCTITTPKNTYAMKNSGYVGTIKNSTLQAGTTTASAYALANLDSREREYTLNLEDYFYVTANGKTACTAYWATNGETKVVTYDYDQPEIDLIGEGNTFKATTTVIANTGIINEINSDDGKLTTVTGSAARGSSIYNYSACLDARTTTTPYTAAASANANGTAGTAVNDDTYLSGAQIGTIKNVYINANGYGVLNGDGTTGKLPTIGEIGEGTEIYAHCTTANYPAVANQNYAEISKITGGLFKVTKATTNAYMNAYSAEGNAEHATLISGGDFQGAANNRDNAIYKPDDTSRVIYPDGKTLSSGTESKTSANANMSGDYYYIASNYTVTFDMKDHGTAPADQTVESGQKATKPADPSATGYTFRGWYSDSDCQTAFNFNTAITKDTTVYAKWEKNKYTITWNNDDGTTIDTTRVGYLEMPTHSNPTKAATAEYTYTFTGWTPVIEAATGDKTYTATYSATKNSYTIRFVNDNGTELQKTKVAYGETPVYNGTTPTKAATAEKTYTFSGWSPAVAAVTGDMTYTATFTESTRKYKITWQNDDGIIIDTTEVAYGTKPTHADATKVADAQYTYNFAGWTPEIKSVTGEATYTASYTSVVNQYDVTFFTMYGYGTAVDKQTVNYGAKVTEPASPKVNDIVKQGDTDYRFDGWFKDSSLTNKWNFDSDTVKGATTIFAKWTTVHTVTFDDGSSETTEIVVAPNEEVTVPPVPEKEPDPQFSYTPVNWQASGDAAVTVNEGQKINASDDVTYVPVYTTTVNRYKVTWLDDQGNTIDTEIVAYNDMPDVPATPTKAATAQYTYTFDHWERTVEPFNASQIMNNKAPASTGSAYDKDIAATGAGEGSAGEGVESVTGQTTYKAVFTQTVNQYTITWKNADGATLKTEQLNYGVTPTAPTDPSKAYADGYVYLFSGWSDGTNNYAKGDAFPTVEGEKTYTALYQTEKIFNKHSLTLDGTIGVSFYTLLPEGYNANNTLMDFTWGNKYISTNTYDENKPYSKLDAKGIADGNYVKFTVYVAAKELNDKITAVLKDKNGDEIARETYRGTDYAYDTLAMTDKELQAKLDERTEQPGVLSAVNLKTLVRDLLIYSAKAQANFKYNNVVNEKFSEFATYKFGTEGFTELTDTQSEVDLTELSENNIASLPAGMSYYGGSLNLGSETSYMVIFQNNNKTTLTVGAKYAGTDTEIDTNVKYSGIATGINLLNLPAAKVTSDIALTINDGSADYTATINTGTYIKAVLNGGNQTNELRNVMKALYYYNQSAVAFFG